MANIILDELLRSRFNGLDSGVELCDEEGRTVAFLVPAVSSRGENDRVGALEAECGRLRDRVKELEKLCYRFLAGWSRERMSNEEVDRAIEEGDVKPLSEFLKELGAR